MDKKQQNFIRQIQKNYEEKTETALEELVALDKKAKRPAIVFSLIFGVIATLVMGTGMCFAMEVIFVGRSWVMPVGIAIGLVGIGLAALNYYLYRVLEQKGKDKYGEEILSLASELLGE